MHVELVLTGRTEVLGLPDALASLFPAHTFEPVLAVPPDRPFDGFTSAPLPVERRKGTDTNADKLVQAMAAQLVPGRRGNPPDLLFVVDDLEPHHEGRESVVVEAFREAVVRHLDLLEASNLRLASDTRAALRDRASLHLIAPMIESWFFADQAALAACGPVRQPVLASVDLERFRATDPEYLSAEGTACPSWLAQSSRRRPKLKPKWLGELPRASHPKAYLQWLCIAPDRKTCTAYDEVSVGGPVLRDLNWTALLDQPPEHMTFLRAMLSDLAEALHEDAAALGITGVEASWTSRDAQPADAVLRNL